MWVAKVVQCACDNKKAWRWKTRYKFSGRSARWWFDLSWQLMKTSFVQQFDLQESHHNTILIHQHLNPQLRPTTTTHNFDHHKEFPLYHPITRPDWKGQHEKAFNRLKVNNTQAGNCETLRTVRECVWKLFPSFPVPNSIRESAQTLSQSPAKTSMTAPKMFLILSTSTDASTLVR